MITREEIAAQMRGVARLLDGVIAPLVARIRTLEERTPLDGKDGRDGIDGKNGEPGRDGTNGEDGANGINGKDGEPGRDGIDGINGKDGRDGKDGINGKDGDRGLDGRDGGAGRDGRDGVDGRDAAHLDVLPEIDFARGSARGTFASHAGGLWRAHANTEGERGWSCIVDGIASISFDSSTARHCAMLVTRSSGALETFDFAAPVPMYRGVFVAGNDYEPGDMVTWGGSLWHCNAPTRDKPDAGGGAWTLAVKRGNHGKDCRTDKDGGRT